MRVLASKGKFKGKKLKNDTITSTALCASQGEETYSAWPEPSTSVSELAASEEAF
jgi:hypothetical protein